MKYFDSEGCFSILTAKILGGAISGAFNAAISYMISAEQSNGGKYDYFMMACNIALGAVNGGVGAVVGDLKLMSMMGVSVAAGIISGIWTAETSNDPNSGLLTGISTGLSMLLGSFWNFGSTDPLLMGQVTFFEGMFTGIPFDTAAAMLQLLCEDDTNAKCANSRRVEQKNPYKPKHINDGFASPGSMGMTSCQFMQWAKQNCYA